MGLIDNLLRPSIKTWTAGRDVGTVAHRLGGHFLISIERVFKASRKGKALGLDFRKGARRPLSALSGRTISSRLEGIFSMLYTAGETHPSNYTLMS